MCDRSHTIIIWRAEGSLSLAHLVQHLLFHSDEPPPPAQLLLESQEAVPKQSGAERG